jgi:hypothetical protein
MTTLLKATIKSVNVQNSKSGSAGFSIVCETEEPNAPYGKVYDWIWREGNTPDPKLHKWASLADPECEPDDAIAVLLSKKMSDLEVDILADTSNDRFWNVKAVGLVGTLQKTTSGVIDDDIPF